MKKVREAAELEKQQSADLEKLLRKELDKEAPDRELVKTVLEILEKRDQKQSLRKQKKEWKIIPGWLRVTAAVVAILITFSLVAPPAFGAENIVELVGQWTDDLFALIRPGTRNVLQKEYVYRTSNPELQKVYDAVKAAGITEPVVPTWIPEGCEATKLEILDTPEGKRITATFENNDSYIMFDINPDCEYSKRKFPKDGQNTNLYEVAGQDHYILPNEDAWLAAWLLDDNYCSIITNYSEETIRRIVRSIYMEGN